MFREKLWMIVTALTCAQAWQTSPLPIHRRRTYTTSTRTIRHHRVNSSPLLMAFSSASSSSSTKEEEGEEYTVQVIYEGKSCEIAVQSNETILAAMERAGVTDQLAITGLPSDCRRGNCLTCTGRHTETSRQASVRRGEDGLSPHMSREVEKRGYILTCSSHVVGEGLQVILGENVRAWNDVYRVRLEEEATQLVARTAMAKTIRLSDEKNLQRWALETEEAFENSGE